MVDLIFREYDIRGKVGEQLYIDQMYALTQAIAYFFLEKNPHVTTVALAMDGRIHSEQLKNEAARALQDSGIHVLFLGMCPTPTLYFSQFTMPVQAGLMITASHNPAEYNGIKIILNQECVWGADLTTIRDYYKKKNAVPSQKRGSYQEIDGVQLYVDYLVDHFKHLKNMSLSVAIDCGNAVGGIVMPSIIKALNWKNVRLLCDDVDGRYPNHEADPVVEKNMQDVKHLLLTDSSLDFGIGLDGDCDRMAPMTKTGY